MFTDNLTILIKDKKRLQWVYMYMSSGSITDLYYDNVPINTILESFDNLLNY